MLSSKFIMMSLVVIYYMHVLLFMGNFTWLALVDEAVGGEVV